MKLKDIKIGMQVVDKFGNEYVVKGIDKPDISMPVNLECTKFIKPILVQKINDIKFDGKGQIFWIYKSKKSQRKIAVKIEILLQLSLSSQRTR